MVRSIMTRTSRVGAYRRPHTTAENYLFLMLTMHNRNPGLRKSSSGAESLQCVREFFLPGEVELFDLGLEQ